MWRKGTPFYSLWLLCLGALWGGVVHAQGWEDITSSVEITHSNRVLDRINLIFFSYVSITNISGADLKGPLRLVIVNPTIPVPDSAGTTDDGHPYQTLPEEAISDGQTLTVRVNFELLRRYLAFNTRLEKQIPSGPDNSVPEIISSPISNATAGQFYAYGVIATDADNDTLTFALLQAPAGMSIDPLTGQVNWTPEASQVGDQAISIRVADGRGGIADQPFIISVAHPPNTIPEFTSTPLLHAVVAEEYTYDADAEDADNDTLTFTLLQAPAGMSIDPLTGQVNWTPEASQVGDQAISIRVADGRG
ncbi:MAG: hypothetical protein GY703_07400, partial [Gammaproteobacteria bacterium]|nr:hypothetical protein [Gammaproteobacteria bacterium]